MNTEAYLELMADTSETLNQLYRKQGERPKPSKWDVRFLKLAEHIAGWSKDPSTKVGAVLVKGKNRIVSVGFNGFPANIKDKEEDYLNREKKLRVLLHSEENLFHFTKKVPKNSTLYTWPFAPCCHCCSHIIQRGVKRVISLEMPEDKKARWAEDMELGAKNLKEAGIELILFKEEELNEAI